MRRPLLVAALLAACLPRPGGEGRRTEAFQVDGQRFEIVHVAADADTAALVADSIRDGLSRVTRFAVLRAPVTITIHPTHEGLEEVAGTDGLHWLRAWARYDAIELQSPRSWSGSVDPARVRDLVLHELTHCAMYQAAGSEWFWGVKGIPFWFAEGMASVVGEPDRQRLGPRELSLFYEKGAEASRVALPPGAALPGGDPLSDPDPLLADRSDVVYGAARLAFQFLVDRYGDDRVRELLRLMGDGHRFDGVFREVVGLSPEAFLSDFRRYLVWRGWERAATAAAAVP